MKNILGFLTGLVFGIVLIESQIVSWYRIQEMVFFDSIHMYGVIGMAILTSLVGLQLIKRFKIKGSSGEVPSISPKIFQKHQIVGGLIFGFGWSISGACPGPIFALIGAGSLPYIVVFISAFFGAYVFTKTPFYK